MVLLIPIFSVVRADVGVLILPGYLMRSPATVRRVQFGSSFCGR